MIEVAHHPNGAAVFLDAAVEGLRPDPRLTVSEWADNHRMLTGVGAREAGRYRVSRTPYWAEPMDCLSTHSPVERVTVMKGAQLGATEFGNNWLGYVVAVAPGPFLMVCPTEGLAKKVSRQRLDPMFLDTPALAGRIQASKERDARSSVLLKLFPGGILSLVGANAGAGFRSMPARYLMRDEVDDYPQDVGDEGDPLLLAERATRTYEGQRKILTISTPTVLGRSRIQREFERGDQRYFHVPCPHCGHMHRLEWDNLRWKSEPEHDPSTAHMVCPECSARIDEHEKTEMLGAGAWVPTAPERSSTHRSYHLSALYSPAGWRTWREIVATFLEAKGKPAEQRTWVNHDLGEVWREKGEAPSWEVIYRRREPYTIGTVPEGGLVLTAGVDVQKDRVELEVVAHGAPREGEDRGETWSVDNVAIPGAPQEPGVWEDLGEYLARDFPHEAGRRLRIARTAIDSGAFTQDVYRWVRSQSVRRVLAVKGVDTMSVVLSQPRSVEVSVQGKRKRRGTVKLWKVGVGILKEALYGALKIEPPLEPGAPYPAGYCHFPEYPEEYFRQLVAEELVPHLVRGYRVYRWELVHGERNEALDCRVYAMAAAESLGIGRWKAERWNARRAELGLEARPTGRGRQRPPGGARRRRRSFL